MATTAGCTDGERGRGPGKRAGKEGGRRQEEWGPGCSAQAARHLVQTAPDGDNLGDRGDRRGGSDADGREQVKKRVLVPGSGQQRLRVSSALGYTMQVYVNGTYWRAAAGRAVGEGRRQRPGGKRRLFIG